MAGRAFRLGQGHKDFVVKSEHVGTLYHVGFTRPPVQEEKLMMLCRLIVFITMRYFQEKIANVNSHNRNESQA